METILLAVGEGDETRIDELAETTADIAAGARASVAIGRVFDADEYETTRDRLEGGDSRGTPNRLLVRSTEGPTPDEVAARYAPVRELADAMTDAGIKHAVHGRVAERGSVGERIAELADEIDADLVVVGGRRRSPAGKAVFGSTAQGVMLNAPCPVTFVREE